MTVKTLRSIQLKHCRIDIGDAWVATHFNSGASYGAEPHYTPEYWALARRCGYTDVMAYCIEHEVAHSLVAQELYSSPSIVIWHLAHGSVASRTEILLEEEMSISLQAFARAGVLPGSSAPGFSWHKLRDEFLRVLD